VRVVSREGRKPCIGVGALVLRADGKISGRNAGGVCGRHGGICGRLGARIVQGRHCCGLGTVVGGVVGAGVRGLQLLAMAVSVSSSSTSSVRT
jgi:hypothetical protein